MVNLKNTGEMLVEAEVPLSERIELPCGMVIYRVGDYKGFSLKSLLSYLGLNAYRTRKLMEDSKVEWPIKKVVVPVIRVKPQANTYDLQALVTLLRLIRDSGDASFYDVKTKATELSEIIKKEISRG